MFLSVRRGLLRLNNFAKLPPENPREIAQCFESGSGQYPASSCFFLPQCPVPEIACTLLRSKWAAGKAVRAGLAVGGRVSQSIRNRRATPPRRPIFIATLRAGAIWLFFCVALSTRIIKIWVFVRALKKTAN